MDEYRRLSQFSGKRGLKLAHEVLMGDYHMNLKRYALRRIDELMKIKHDPPRDTAEDVEEYIKTAREMEI